MKTIVVAPTYQEGIQFLNMTERGEELLGEGISPRDIYAADSPHLEAYSDVRVVMVNRDRMGRNLPLNSPAYEQLNRNLARIARWEDEGRVEQGEY